MTTKEILHTTDDKMKKAFESVIRDFSEIRTGRASPTLVEGIFVDYYGTPTLLKQLASISAPDAHLLVIQPWDASAIPEIEKAIMKSNLGINPSNDGKVIRLSVPQLSKDRRQELAKVIHKMSEEGRISLRTIRRDAKEHLEKLEKDKVISEDDKFRGLDELQKNVDKYILKVDELLKNKEKEILEF
ncbi:MAG: ribosome recycling factor [Candidatus Omnitrophica bacterium]|jgi:ribosome recycling factor|nr:ribosome recycling factor [Candidatus Omnitrophota bacterium]MDD3987643.1 ribosome recycling factor [Candidatus Omnitrophota bacterium]MDD4981180.1 ribosome recycling factor [Candidatus Omnitrophota bacterium]MDD5665568.1 ribosome recycling factor [Candidatus Omnitrophota bacterium]